MCSATGGCALICTSCTSGCGMSTLALFVAVLPQPAARRAVKRTTAVFLMKKKRERKPLPFHRNSCACKFVTSATSALPWPRRHLCRSDRAPDTSGNSVPLLNAGKYKEAEKLLKQVVE